MSEIRFKFSPAKALEAISWMLCQRQSLDLHSILKTCYFADKEHLNQYGRPIFGATYRAMRFGPVPLEIYEMLKGENIWLAELGESEFPWTLNGYNVQAAHNRNSVHLRLSESDLSCLEKAFSISINMTFNERTAATHGPDWQAAELGFMRYEDMIDDDKKEKIIPELRDTARFMRL